jgi:methyl-accepting chemotaxis protein
MNLLDINPRRLGTAMLAFGMTGVILAGLIAVALFGGAVAARNLDDRLVADQNRIAAALTRLTLTMDTLAVTVEHGGDTLASSRDAMTHAADLLKDVAATSTDLANALDISILGSQPFASAANGVRDVGAKTATFAQDATALAATLDANVADATTMAGQIRTATTQTSELAASVVAFDRIDQIVGLLIGGIVLAGLLTLWVAVAAAGCAWLGWRLRRLPAVAEGQAG